MCCYLFIMHVTHCWLLQVFMGSSIDTVTAVAEMVFTAVCAKYLSVAP